MKAWLAKRSDETLALLCAAAVFVLCAWPLLLVDVPPYQDVANHLAVSTIIDFPADYPDYVFTGFVKTNAAFYAWEHFVGHAIGHLLAIRLFAAIVLAANAIAFTRLLVVLGGRDKLLVGSLFIAPMVHNWCVCLGLLDFALGFPVSLLLLVEMIKQRRAPSAIGAARIAAMSVLAWYTHVIPLFLAHVLVLIELVVTIFRSRKEAWQFFVKCILPMAPGTILTLASVLGQLLGRSTIKVGDYTNIWLAPWDLFYNLWAEWFFPFTHASTVQTIVPCIVLAVIAWRRRRERATFFEPWAFLVLGAMYTFVPYVFSFWAYANTRIAAFLWVAALVRVPPRLPKWVSIPLALCTLGYSVSLGVDYIRLDRDQKEFTAGIPYVPEHAKLLPMVFEPKGISINTKPLTHTWGFYVREKRTAAPGVFASSRMYGVTYRQPPEQRQLEHIALDGFAKSMRDPKWMCKALHGGGVYVGDCEATWHEYWRAYWELLEPRYDWLLLWDPLPITMTVIPPAYTEVFRQGRLVIMHRP